jgi:hypothetical protein
VKKYVGFMTGATDEESVANLQKAMSMVGDLLWQEALKQIAVAMATSTGDARYHLDFILTTEPIKCRVWESVQHEQVDQA